MSPGAPPYLPQSNDLLAGSPCPSKAPPVTGGWWLATKYPHRQECSPSREPTQVPHLVTLHPGWASRVLGGCGSGLGSPLWLDAGIPWPGGWPCQPPVPDLSLPPPEADLWHLAPEPVHKVTGPSHPTPGVLCYPLSGFSTMTSFLSASFFLWTLEDHPDPGFACHWGEAPYLLPSWPCPLGWTLQWVQGSVPHLWAHKCL